jgi:hypothetical protein
MAPLSVGAAVMRRHSVTAHKTLDGGLRISKALVKGKALAKGASKATPRPWLIFSHASRWYQKQ